MPMPMISTYLEPVITKPQVLIPAFIEYIEKQNLEFDAILCRGTSGIIPASIIGYLLDVPVVVVRKHEETSHSYTNFEGQCYDRYIIIDDMIDSGATIDAIIKEAKDAAKIPNNWIGRKCRESKIVGIFLYNYAFSPKTRKKIKIYPFREYIFKHDEETFNEIYR